IAERLLEHGDRALFDLAFDLVERAVHDLFGDRLLALLHHGIHEAADGKTAEFRIRQEFAAFGAMTAGHLLLSSARHFGRLAPYSERRCLRFLTPCVSSTPRRM